MFNFMPEKWRRQQTKVQEAVITLSTKTHLKFIKRRVLSEFSPVCRLKVLLVLFTMRRARFFLNSVVTSLCITPQNFASVTCHYFPDKQAFYKISSSLLFFLLTTLVSLSFLTFLCLSSQLGCLPKQSLGFTAQPP